MVEKEVISEEAFNEIVDGFEFVEKLTPYGRKNLKYHIKRLQQENQELKNQQKEFIKQLEKLAHRDMVYSDFANGCKAAYGIVLNKYKEIIGGDNK